LVRLKIAAITKCSACEIARKSDEVSEDDIACLTWDSPRFSPAEQAALHYAELFAFDYFAIDERIYEKLELHFSTEEIVELNMFSALMLAGGRMTYVQRGYPEQATEAVTAPAQ
jgi:alkylhydroperoxidase family enzyme